MRKQDDRIRGVLRCTSDIVAILDARGMISYSTPSLASVLGLPPASVLGCRLADFLGEGEADEAEEMFAGFDSGLTATQVITDWHLRSTDGTTVAFEVLFHNLLRDPQVDGIAVIMRDVSERRALEVQLTHQALHDPLTGLPNRALFQDRVEHALARTSRLGTVVAVLVVNLDDFKVINDGFGEVIGDGLLVQASVRLQSLFRDGATISRSGGDEFSILVEELSGVWEAEQLAARVLQALSEPFTVRGQLLRVAGSVGLVVSGGTREVPAFAELLRRAHVALYEAKDRGKGQVMLFHKDLRARTLEMHRRRGDLERAIDGNEFVLHFQPIASIPTGAIVGCEALVRWQHPAEGLLPPAEFVELSEETGLIVELGRWVLEEACAQMRMWVDAGHALRMSVNVSARQLREDGFVEDVRRVLRLNDVQPELLVLELTESIFALDASAISEKLRALRELGVKIAMDDFGTGYSSLSYLQKFQMDILKIDKSFVDGLGAGDPDAGSLVAAIIALALALRLEVVAEGIERPEQSDELWEMGCSLGQGFWFSRPVEPHRIPALIAAAACAGTERGVS